MPLGKKPCDDWEWWSSEKKYDLAWIEFAACVPIAKDAALLRNLRVFAGRRGQTAHAVATE